MNLVIVDQDNKKYHPYSTSTDKQEMFICGHIMAINKKNDTYLIVQRDCNLNELVKNGFEKDDGMFEKLVMAYNKNLEPEDQRLDLWKRF